MHTPAPRLLVVAHGTASPAGRRTAESLTAAVAALRPDVTVDLCFLDVLHPRLADVLDERPTVVVPALLSTGYHVQSDIPAAVAPYPRVAVARHLGPDPLLARALAERLTGPAAPVLLVAAGSSRPEAAAEVRAQAGLLAELLEREVGTATVADDLSPLLATGPVQVATYLLAEGRFTDTIRAAAGPQATVAPPLGVHPAVVELVWRRYDDVAAAAVR